MNAWWEGLSALNRVAYGAAIAACVPFLWQLAAAILGLAGGDTESDADASGDHSGDHADASETIAAFKLLSVRSILTFVTLFCWAMALHLNNGVALSRVLLYASIWGVFGMGSMALLLYLLPKLAHTGTQNVDTCVGAEATVYLDIPPQGTGEVRTTVSGAVTHVRARSAGGAPLKAGAVVTVVRRLDGNTVEVAPVRPA